MLQLLFVHHSVIHCSYYLECAAETFNCEILLNIFHKTSQNYKI